MLLEYRIIFIRTTQKRKTHSDGPEAGVSAKQIIVSQGRRRAERLVNERVNRTTSDSGYFHCKLRATVKVDVGLGVI